MRHGGRRGKQSWGGKTLSSLSRRAFLAAASAAEGLQREQPGRPVLANLPTRIADILAMIQLISVFDTYDSVNDAVMALS